MSCKIYRQGIQRTAIEIKQRKHALPQHDPQFAWSHFPDRFLSQGADGCALSVACGVLVELDDSPGRADLANFQDKSRCMIR